MIAILTKVCGKCKKDQPATAEYFYNKTCSKDGLASVCKKCRKEQDKQRYYSNHDKFREEQKQRWLQNPTYFLEYATAYREKHREMLRIKGKEWRKQNPEREKQRRKRYYTNQKERYAALFRCINHKRMAARRSLPASYTSEQWVKTKIYFDNKCAYCGKEKKLTQDHFVPVSKGGEYTINNIVPACKACNCSKQDSDFFNWYPQQKFYSKKRARKILKYLNYQDGIQQLMMDYTNVITLSTAEKGAK